MEKRSRTQSKYIVVALAVTLCFFCSCRFKLPTQSEGQALAREGLFPDGAQPWVQPSEDADAARPGKAGIVPRSFGPSVQASRARALSPDSRASVRDTIDEERREIAQARSRTEVQVQAQRDAAAEEEAEESPLDRIERACPGLESSVSDAISTVNRDVRINKYSKLTRRCPSSADIWFWLGKDYEEAGRFQEAARAFERVLTIDRDNDVAKTLLKVVKEKAVTAN